MNKINLRWMARISLFAAIYVVLTLICYPLSFGLIQIRFSEALMLLVLIDKRYTISLTLGCLISNIINMAFGGGVIDIFFGTLATFISCIIMIFIKNHWIASVVPAIINGLIVGFELWYLFQYNYFVAAGCVAAGEVIAICIIGNIGYEIIVKNKSVLDKLKN